MRRWLVSSVLLVACHGDEVVAGVDAASQPADGENEAAIDSAVDTAVDSASDAAADAGCGSEDNLLNNGSFEDWTGTSAVSWGSGSVVEHTDGAQNCARWAEFANTCYGEVGQRIDASLPAGTVLEFGLSARWISGDRNGPGVDIHLGEPIIGTAAGVMLPSDGSWVTIGNTLTLKEATTGAQLAFVIEAVCYEQRIGLDHAFLRVRK